jgi:hypothetical protein
MEKKKAVRGSKCETSDAIESASKFMEGALMQVHVVLRHLKKFEQGGVSAAKVAKSVAHWFGNVALGQLDHGSTVVLRVNKWLDRSCILLSGQGRRHFEAPDDEFDSLNWHRALLNEIFRFYHDIAVLIGYHHVQDSKKKDGLRHLPRHIKSKLKEILAIRPTWSSDELRRQYTRLMTEASQAIVLWEASPRTDADEAADQKKSQMCEKKGKPRGRKPKTNRDKKIMDFILANPTMTRQQVADRWGLKKGNVVTKILSKAKEPRVKKVKQFREFPLLTWTY